MKRLLILLALLLPAMHARAFDESPPISITSPDEATTYSYNSIKQHVLIWNDKKRLLIAHVVFTPVDSDDDAGTEDAHDFRLPGVNFDPKTGIFSALSARGDSIPVARMKKSLFLKTIETLPNAVVRIRQNHGHVEVVMEAIRPDSPAMREPPASAPAEPHTVDIKQILH